MWTILGWIASIIFWLFVLWLVYWCIWVVVGVSRVTSPRPGQNTTQKAKVSPVIESEDIADENTSVHPTTKRRVHKCVECSDMFECYRDSGKHAAKTGPLAAGRATGTRSREIRDGVLAPQSETDTDVSDQTRKKEKIVTPVGPDIQTPQQRNSVMQATARRRRRAYQRSCNRAVQMKRSVDNNPMWGGLGLPTDSITAIGDDTDPTAGKCCSSLVPEKAANRSKLGALWSDAKPSPDHGHEKSGTVDETTKMTWRRFCSYDCYAKHRQLGDGKRAATLLSVVTAAMSDDSQDPIRTASTTPLSATERRRRQRSKLLVSEGHLPKRARTSTQKPPIRHDIPHKNVISDKVDPRRGTIPHSIRDGDEDGEGIYNYTGYSNHTPSSAV